MSASFSACARGQGRVTRRIAAGRATNVRGHPLVSGYTVYMMMLLLLAFARAADVPTLHPVGQLSVSPRYVVSPGDVLTLDVYGEPDLSGELRVSEKGEVTIPHVGKLYAVGLTLDQMEQQIGDILAKSILVSPQVTVGVKAFANSVEVMGQVRSVGRYPITEANMTVRAMLTNAGGAENNIPRIYLQRGDQTFTLDMEAIASGSREADMEVLPGDVIVVPPPPTVQVQGEVKDPALVPYRARMRFSDAIAAAGGLSPLADKRRILLTRDSACTIAEPPSPADGEPIRLNFVRISKQQDKDPELCPNDKIQVLQSVF